MTKKRPGKTIPQFTKESEILPQQVPDLNNSESIAHILEASELRYRRLFETAQDGILILDAETGEINDVNPFLIEIIGYSKEELIGKKLWELGLFKNTQLAKSAFRELQTKEYIRYEDMPLETKNGLQIEVEFVSNVYPINGERVIQCNIRDITERKHVEEELRDYRDHLEEIVKKRTDELEKANRKLQADITEHKQDELALLRSEENFRRSLEDSPLGIRIANEEDETIYINRALLDMFGYSSVEEAHSISYQEVYTPESLVSHRERIMRRKRGETVPSSYEVDVRRKNGEIHRLMTNRGEVLWNGQKQVQGLYQDITDRVQAEKALIESYDKLDKALEASIQTIALTVEVRDPYTAGHQRRVANLACAIAGELGLSEDKIHGIRVAGIIHDIGKTCVPSEILSKPGRLSEIEFDMIKMHAQAGYDILKLTEFPWPVARTVLQHHERMDGSGYPGKLPGKDIILEARIIAVADVVEAMASHRPYRPSLGIDRALAEIAQKKGILYDSDVVDACLKVFRDKGFKFE